jgi:phage-related protein
MDTKPVKTVGRGVCELRVSYRGQFRLIYVLKKAGAIHVLHAFSKKTRKTNTRDIRLARQRYKEI